MAVGLPSQLILEIEQGFNELRKEYTLFLNGVTKLEPYELRENLAAKLKRLRNLNFHKTEDQFRANNAISKIQSHFQLWDRQLEKKYSGDGLLARKKKTNLPPPAPEKPSPQRGIVISDPIRQRDQMEKLYDEYMRLNLSMGKTKVINFTKFQSFIQNQTDKMKSAKNVDRVCYEVGVQDDKVVIKSLKVKE